MTLPLDAGFSAFRGAVQAMVDDLGEISMKMVGEHASEWLNMIYRNEGGNDWTKDGFHCFWFRVSGDQMERAAEQILRISAEPVREFEVSRIPWRAGHLSMRELSCWYMGATYSFQVGGVYTTREYSTKERDYVTRWNVHLTDHGERLLNNSVGHDRSHAGTEKAASQALRRMMEKKFGVEFFAE